MLKIWIQDRCKKFDVGSIQVSRMREEQERVVSLKKEEQRQIERPFEAHFRLGYVTR